MLARRRWLLGLIVLGFLTCLGAFLLLRNASPESKNQLTANNREFNLEVLTTDSSRQLGLSGRESIAADHAVLFKFDGQATRCFWMKDMRFSIDMIWLDADQRVTAIEHNVSPSTYPADFCHDGMYVVEWNAGLAKKSDLKIGSQFAF